MTFDSNNNLQPPSVGEVSGFLEELAPVELAEDWDNVGLLIGHRDRCVHRIMTCLTLSQRPVDEAIRSQADLVVVHHPLPFRPLSSIVADNITGSLILRLAESGVAVYSPHTAWDNCRGGINDQLAALLGLDDTVFITPAKDAGMRSLNLGAGRCGSLSRTTTIRAVIEKLQQHLPGMILASNAQETDECRRIAIVCGSGGSFISGAAKCGADLLITGEATYHQFLEATALGLNLLTIGHYASERFAMEQLANRLQRAFESAEVWPSQFEQDSMRLVSQTNWKSSYVIGETLD